MIRSIRHITDQAVIGLWKITETLEELYDLQTSEDNINHFHPKKQAEHLASRALIQELALEIGLDFEGIWKDEHGKPHFVDSPIQLSISHSHPWVACMVHLTQSCGIDIESPREQLLRIRHKFLNDQENLDCGQDLNKLCKIWAAKETIYKIYGRKYLSFKNDIRLTSQGSNLIAEVHQDNVLEVVILTHEELEGYHLVYGNL